MKRLLQKFTVYDLVVMAIMAALGIAIKPVVVPLAHLISGPLMIPSGAFAGGLYMMWIVIGYGIVKKPGTATIIALVQALLVMFTGVVGSHGIMSLLTYVAPGLAVDITFLLIGHRACCRYCDIIAGAVANVTGTACVNVIFFQAPGAYLVLILAAAAVSGGIGGFLAWELLKVLCRYRVVKPQETEECGRHRISGRLMAVMGIIIIAAGGTAAYMHISANNDAAAGTDEAGYSISIVKDGKTADKITLEEIKKMQPLNVKLTIRSSSRKDETSVYTGVQAKDILNQADPELLKKYSKFIFTAGDGYSAAFTAKEINRDQDVMLIYSRNGKSLEPYNDGGTGPMRLVVRSDTYGTRSVMYLTKIQCR